MPLFHCVGNDNLSYIIAIGSVGVAVNCFFIAFGPWLRSFFASSDQTNKEILFLLICIFVSVGLCGYVPNTLSVWFPGTAYKIKVFFIIFLNIFCPLFLFYSRRKKFLVKDKHKEFSQKVNFLLEHPDRKESEKLIEEIREIRNQTLSF